MTTRVGIEHSHNLSEISYAKAGLVGLIAALIQAAVVMPLGALVGQGFLAFPKGTASLFLSETAAGTSVGIITGLITQMGLGIVFGLIFAVFYILVTSEYSLLNAIILGIGYGLLLWVINFAIIGPTLVPLLVNATPAWVAVLGELIYGGVLGFYARWH